MRRTNARRIVSAVLKPQREAGDRQRRVASEILLNQGQSEIDPGRDAGGRVKRAVFDVDLIGFEMGLWMSGRQFGRVLPVRRSASTI
jgi:hypothetical protein